MAVSVQCPKCGARFRAPDGAIGRKAPCGKCGEPFTLTAVPRKPTASAAPGKGGVTAQKAPPAAAGASQKKPVKLTPGRLAAAFRGAIDPVPATWAYRLSLLFSTLVMLLLPLMYLALIALACLGVYYHAVNNASMLDPSHGRVGFYSLLAYTAPLLVGPILVFFMVKPLFAQSANQQRTRSLTREREPLLFAFVDKVCDVVDAPRPRRIDVDCQVNASASFRRGVWSMLGNDLVLTIGVPLAAGMSTRQLGGVLAHEFGHFSQGVGMRLTYLLRSVSHWFARVAYERDSWDQWLATAAGGIDIRIGWIFFVAMLVVWLTRKVLWVLLHLGFAVAGHTLRQMEFDADRYEARLAGSANFAASTRRLQELGVGMQIAHSQLGQSHRDGKLVDNLPGLVRINADKLPDAAVKYIDEQLERSQTGWFDTHPCDKDRIASAEAEHALGVFSLDVPASELFSDFDAQCKATTWDFYLVVLDGKVDKSSLQPLRELAAAHEQQDQAGEALRRYTQDTWRPFRVQSIAADPLLEPDKPEQPQQVLTRLKVARNAVVAGADAARELLRQQDKQEGRLSMALRVNAVYKAGVSVPKKSVEAEFQSRESTRRARADSKRLIAEYDKRLEAFDKDSGDRLRAALELLRFDGLAKRLPDIRLLRERAEALVAAQLAIDDQMDTINELYARYEEIQQLASLMDGSQPTNEFIGALTGSVKSAHGKFATIRGMLSHTAYPFPHTEEGITVGQFLAPAPAAIDDVQATYNAVTEMMDRLVPLRHRIASELYLIAEQVEQAVGLPPLEAPPEEPADGEAPNKKANPQQTAAPVR